MTEKEILAEYKIAYRQLEDIMDNADETQIANEEKEKVGQMMKNLEILYRELYERIKSAEDISLYYEENLLIANEIYHDYVTKSEDYDDQYLTYADIKGESKWWEDYDFLTEF